VTLVSGSTGLPLDGSGLISSSNSLVGSQTNDQVGNGLTVLADGNYVVASPNWANGSASAAGAVTLVSGRTGLAFKDGRGTISPRNSLVGSQTNDQVGDRGVTVLADGNYVVVSLRWANGSASNAGAVTLVSGRTGLPLDGRGLISSSNSLVGSQAEDQVGNNGGIGNPITVLADGNYVVNSFVWANGSASGAGAVTLVSGRTGLPLDGSGTISSTNSLVGSHTNDLVGLGFVGLGGVTVLADGNYVVSSESWANGSARDAGAVTLVSGRTGLPLNGSGVVSAQNSLLGLTASSGFSFVALDPVTGAFLAASANDGTGRVVAGLDNPNQLTYSADQGQTISLTPAPLLMQALDAGTAVVLQASNDITVNAPITVSAGGHGGSLTLQAGRSILLNASITTDNGNLTLIANDLLANGVSDSDRTAGNAVITMAARTALNAGTGSITIDLRPGTGKSNTASGAITLQTVTAGSLAVSNNGPSAGGDIDLGRVTTTGPQTFSSPNGTTNVRASLSAHNSPITFNGNTLVGSGVSIAPGSSSIDFSGSGTQALSSAIALGNVLHDGSGTLQLMSNLTLTGSFTNASGTFDATSRTVRVLGNWTWLAGTFLSTGSTVQFSGGAQTVTSGGQAFNNLTHAGSNSLALADNLVLTGTFINTSGTLDTTSRTVQILGDWTWLAGTFVSTASTVQFSGGAQTLTSGGQAFNNLTHSGAGLLRLAGNSLAVRELLASSSLTVGDLLAGNSLTVNGVLINAAGAGDFQSNNLGVTVAGATTLSGGTYHAGSAATFFNGGLILSGGNFTATSGAVTAAGITINPGSTLTAPRATLTDSGNFAMNGAFLANGGTVALTGTNQQVSGSTTFFNLTKTVTSADTLTFAAGSTQTIGGTLTLKGTTGHLLVLRSSVPGTPWNIDPLGTIAASFLDVQDSDNTAGPTKKITATNSHNSGNNTNWLFP
jgi:hypothetical protein